MKGDRVNLVNGAMPADYHCRCEYCEQYIGELRPQDGSYYSRLERRKYYDPSESGEGGHIAKTPLHIARWAVQRYTKPGDWVLDPTIGAGTTAVEAITQGRNAAGMEIQYEAVLRANISKNVQDGARAEVRIGDARSISAFLDERLPGTRFALVVSNPPYSGDESMPSPSKAGRGKEHRDEEVAFFYQDGLPNLAFLKEDVAYWSALAGIYRDCASRLAPGGRFVVGVKDMMRSKRPFLLHKLICDLLCSGVGLQFEGTALLRHYPGTLFMNAYEKMHGAKPPLYQTISVFQRE